MSLRSPRRKIKDYATSFITQITQMFTIFAYLLIIRFEQEENNEKSLDGLGWLGRA